MHRLGFSVGSSRGAALHADLSQVAGMLHQRVESQNHDDTQHKSQGAWAEIVAEGPLMSEHAEGLHCLQAQ